MPPRDSICYSSENTLSSSVINLKFKKNKKQTFKFSGILYQENVIFLQSNWKRIDFSHAVLRLYIRTIAALNERPTTGNHAYEITTMFS